MNLLKTPSSGDVCRRELPLPIFGMGVASAYRPPSADSSILSGATSSESASSPWRGQTRMGDAIERIAELDVDLEIVEDARELLAEAEPEAPLQ